MQGRGRSIGLFLAVMALSIALQWEGGAYRVALGEHGDEPAHFVTGLMVRDWVAAGFPRPAIRYAEDYYLHYPRVAFGHWPPMFYIFQAAWELVFPPSGAGVLLLIAVLTAVFCLRTAHAVERYAAGWAGPPAALLLLAMPPVIIYSRMIMAEVLLSWLCLEAVLAFAEWMDAPGWRAAGLFAFWATAACLTKVTAVWLAPMVALAILFSGRWKLLAEKSLWCAGLTVAILTLPWYFLAPGALHQASPDDTGIAITAGKPVSLMRLPHRLKEAAELFGIVIKWMGPILLAAFYGMWSFWRRGRAIGSAAAASLAGMMLMRFSVLATGFEDRTVMPLVAPLLVCAAGAIPLMTRFPVASVAALAAFASANLLTTLPKQDVPVESAVVASMRPEYKDAVLMVASDAFHEGAFIAAIATGESPRPGHTVLRASKILARATWNANRYTLLTRDTVESMALIERIPVGLLVMESDPRRWKRPHMKLLARTIAAHRDRFKLIASGQLLVFEVAGYRDRPRQPVPMFMYGLGRSIGE